MKWFNNLKVAYKVLLSCSLFITIILVISYTGYRSQKNQSVSYDSFYNERFKSLVSLQLISKDILQMQTNIYRQTILAKTNKWENIDKIRNESKLLREEYLKYWDQYNKAVKMNDDEKKLTQNWMDSRNSLAKITDQFNKNLDFREANAIDDTIRQWEILYEPVKTATQNIINYQDKIALQLKNEQLKSSKRDMIITLTLLGISILIGIIVTIILARSVSGPVNKGLSFAKKMAEGDFTERIDLDQKDELGVLGASLNTTADNLEKLISEIVFSAQSLTQAVQEIASGNENLSQRTSEQASSLEEIASTIEQTAAAIVQNAENSTQADKLSFTTKTEAEEGGKVIYEAVSAINDISESSKKIEEIITVINEISFQTNLLALNAAVEAARAGEQGRGFAVVAGEVRNLAQRSGTAAKQIADLIKDSRIKVEKGTALANKSGEAQVKINKLIKDLSKLISEINAASEEQRQGVSQINVAISELDSMTQQNAGLVEETSGMSEEMANQAQELLAMVEHFKIRNSIAENTQMKKHNQLHLKNIAIAIPKPII